MREIRLKPDDVRRLYGTRFFVVSEKEATIALVETQDENPSLDQHPTETPLVEKPAITQAAPPATPEEPEVIVFEEKATPLPPTAPEPGSTPPTSPEPEIVAEQPAMKEPATYALNSGPAVTWKMRRTSQLALVLDQESFKNPAMTLILKDCVTKAGLNTQIIGFGILEGEGPHWDFRAIPVPQAVIFHPFEGLPSPVTIEDKQLHIFHSLKDIVFDPAKQQALVQLLSNLSFTS